MNQNSRKALRLRHDTARDALQEMFMAAVMAADPMRCVTAALPERPEGRVVVIGAGKASARMAEAVETSWGACEGLIITRDGYGRALQGIEVLEAAHPVPDHRGLIATERLLNLVSQCSTDDFVLTLISGGASSLLTRPAREITLKEEQDMSLALLTSGAPISEMNVIRKHLSYAKGGGLAAACPAEMLTLIISDVPGDDPAVIASGPTVGDNSTAAEAYALMQKWHIPITPAMNVVLSGPRTTILPEAPELSRVSNRIIVAPSQSLAAAQKLAEAKSWHVKLLGDALEGEARELAADHARLATSIQSTLTNTDVPVLLLSGGECTVTKQGGGIGGPNAEYALALAIALNGNQGISAIACDTDGVDGAAEVAGAFVDGSTLKRAAAMGHNALRYLATNDSHSFFEALGDQVITGPTLTNVNDFRAILIAGPDDPSCD